MLKDPKILANLKLQKMQREAEEREAQRKAKASGNLYVNLITAPINIEALALIPREVSEAGKIAAVSIQSKRVAIAVVDPEDSQAKKTIEELKSRDYQPSIFVVSPYGLHHVQGFYKFISEIQEEITGKVRIEEKNLVDLKNKITSLETLKRVLTEITRTKSDVSQVLEAILAGALANRASDIHLEPEEHIRKMRLRIDGLLHDVFTEFDSDIYLRLMSRIKLLSELKINIYNEAQDGRFSIALPEKEIEIRTSIIPSEFGESAVLRILDPDAIKLTLQDLGLRNDDLEIVEKELKRPNGMIFNTGPTGSGKTTTLYAFLRHVRNPEIKIITVEDPIEYHLEGIEQTQTDSEAGYTFASGLRSILRQDPDMILIGEVRDLETAEIAMHAALTGHLVFSTLHTNDAAGAIPRLIDIGVKPMVIAPAVNLIIAQRLVRKLCQKCRAPKVIDEALKNKISKILEKLPSRVSRDSFKEINYFQPKGCPECNNTGYHGRIAIFELLKLDNAIKLLISESAIETKIYEAALQQGMVTMQQDGILKATTGMTTLEEVEATTGPIE